MPLGYFINVQ